MFRLQTVFSDKSRATTRTTVKSRTQATVKSKDPLSPKFARLLKEASWIVSIAIGIYIALILSTYHRTDSGFSSSGHSAVTQNKGGNIGAWLSDFLLYMFGLSAWWWVVLGLLGIYFSYHRIESSPLTDKRPFYISLSGFVVLLLGSAGLEALRLYSLKVSLPYEAGGVFGALLSNGLGKALGFTGATLIFLALIAIGLSLFTGLSWLKFVERVGYWLEIGYFSGIERIQSWRDRRKGEKAIVKREEKVAEVRKKMEDRKPVRIEPQVTEIQVSKRAIEEKQAPLFADLQNTDLPPLSLLDPPSGNVETVSPETLEFTSRLIARKLADFNVEVKVLAAYPGPVITRYEIEPATGVKGSQIVNLVKDLARALSVTSIRVVETIPGKSCMGMEIPNPHRQMVRLSEILGSKVYNDMGSPLTLALGKDISGKPSVGDLAKMPHVLVAGTTGSGKSVAINAMILSILYKATPSQVRLILIDPKMLELSVYDGIPHLLAPVVTDMKQAGSALNWSVAEMERRYKLMSSLGVRNLAGYNVKVKEAIDAGKPLTNPFTLTPDDPEPLEELPLIVVVIDELADLMMVVGKKVEELIARIAQKARAAGIHLMLATQRPSVDVITGLIKANIPTRIAFQVASKIDSRTILDQMGAEALLGQGDMLYLPPGSGLPQRVHGAFVADNEVHKVVTHLKSMGEPQYIEGILTGSEEIGGSLDLAGNSSNGSESDPLYDEAVSIVLKSRRASISFVQRNLRIGYNRSARLLEEMEKSGLVSSMQTNGNREVLVPAGQGE